MSLGVKDGRRTRSASFSIIPILVVAITIIGCISLLSKSAYEANKAMERQTDAHRIEAALDNAGRDFADAVQREVMLMVQSAPERRVDMENLSRHISSEHNVDFIAVYAKSGKLLSVSSSRPEILERRHAAADALLAERRELRTPYAIRRIGMSNTLVDPKAIVSMAAINVNDMFDVVATRRFDDSALTKIGAELLLHNLRFRDVELTSPDMPEEVASAIVWHRVDNGLVTLSSIAHIGYLGISVISLYGLLVFIHVGRVTRALESSEAEAQHMANHDALSGLPNRVLFSKMLNLELGRIVRDGGGLSVMYLDLDKFKEVNDQYGHVGGDRLIMSVADRLRGLIRTTDTVARFGGDEFAIIQANVKSPGDPAALANRILDSLRQPFLIEGAEVEIGVSVGISVAPENSIDAATLMRYADAALYRAKNEGRNRYSFFQQQLNEALKSRKAIEDDLRAGIENNELMLYYQPVVTADGGRIVSAEALVRWNHPTRGLIPPNDFISIAEERGLIGMLGEWVLRKACEDARHWPELMVAVNVSPVQFRQKDFVRTVGRILAETGMDPTRLELELTEGVVVDDADQAEAAMIELRAMGVRLALDDFGVGYSSLIYLRRFAFDKIKIDRYFLESMESTGESAILVHSIVHLGRALGLQVTAEGVETEEQRRFLQAVGCHYLQGYYFARPMPEAEIWTYIQQAGLSPKTDVNAA